MNIQVEKITNLDLAKEGINFSRKGFDSKIKNLKKLYASEHSPMYTQIYILRLYDIPYFTHTHIRTHKKNFIFESVTTSRPDITGKKRTADLLVDMIIICNAKTIVDMMLKRLCAMASMETQIIFNLILDKLKEQNDELSEFCVPKCVYRNGICGEFKCCGFNKTESYKRQQIEYNKNFNVS